MPDFGNRLAREDIDDLVAFLQSLEEAAAGTENTMIALALAISPRLRPPAPARSDQSEGRVGEALHVLPRRRRQRQTKKGQQYKAPDFTNAKWQKHTTDDEIVDAITDGVPKTKMPAFRKSFRPDGNPGAGSFLAAPSERSDATQIDMGGKPPRNARPRAMTHRSVRKLPSRRTFEAFQSARRESRRPTVYTEAMEVFHRAADLIGLDRRVRMELEEPDYEHIFYVTVKLHTRLVAARRQADKFKRPRRQRAVARRARAAARR